MKKTIFILLTATALSLPAVGQVSSQFSGDASKFTAELTSFMGTLVSKPQKAEVDLFISLYDSTCFSTETRDLIVNVASQLRGRRISQVPGFINYVRTLTDFVKPTRVKMRSAPG